MTDSGSITSSMDNNSEDTLEHTHKDPVAESTIETLYNDELLPTEDLIVFDSNSLDSAVQPLSATKPFSKVTAKAAASSVALPPPHASKSNNFSERLCRRCAIM
jgi:hypothetical protein